MFKIRGGKRLSDYSETQDESSTFETSVVSFDKDLISKANTVPLVHIFKKYNILLSDQDRKARCPFPSHNGGRETSASMFYYPDSNSFFCFGCRKGGKSAHAVEFLSFYKGISKLDAANLIVHNWSNEVTNAVVDDYIPELLSSHLEFSALIKNFRSKFYDVKSEQFINHISSVYDKMCVKHSLSKKALIKLCESLKEKIEEYK